MNRKHAFLAAFVITIGMISWGDISKCKELPWPPRFVAAAITFGLLDLFSVVQEELAGIVAIGIVLAAIVNKGFASDCQHTEATAQPVAFETLTNNTSGTTVA